MRIIFVRHGEPDYTTDTLNEKGKREAELLANRAKDWNIKDIYVSPFGRAQQTAAMFRQGNGAVDAFKQGHPQFIFQLSHLLREGTLCDVELS